jgi:hypothetical protein
MKRLAALLILAAPLPAIADPGPPQEGCGFLPIAQRMLLPPDHPCYIPPPEEEVCYEGGWMVVCSGP